MEETKPCRLCGESVKSSARVCPHCHQWQSWWSMSQASPAVFAWLSAAVVIAVFWSMSSSIMRRNFLYETEGALTITESRFEFARMESQWFITTLGTIRNNTDKTWTNLHFAVRYYNNEGKMVDVINENQYHLVIAPRSEAAFRVRAQAATEQGQYARHEVRITKAEEDSWP